MRLLDVVRELTGDEMNVRSFSNEVVQNSQLLREAWNNGLPLDGLVECYKSYNPRLEESNKRIHSLLGVFLVSASNLERNMTFDDLVGDLWRQRVRNNTPFWRKYLVLAAVCGNWIKPSKQFIEGWRERLNLSRDIDCKREHKVLVLLCQKWITHHIHDCLCDHANNATLVSRIRKLKTYEVELSSIFDEQAHNILLALFFYGYRLSNHAHCQQFPPTHLSGKKERAGYLLFSRRINPGMPIRLTPGNPDFYSLGRNLLDFHINKNALRHPKTGTQALFLMEISRRSANAQISPNFDPNTEFDLAESADLDIFLFVVVCIKVLHKLHIAYFQDYRNTSIKDFDKKLKSSLESLEEEVPLALKQIYTGFFDSTVPDDRHHPRRRLQAWVKSRCASIVSQEFMEEELGWNRVPNSFLLCKEFEIAGFRDGRNTSLYRFITDGEFFKNQLKHCLNADDHLSIPFKSLLNSFNVTGIYKEYFYE